MVTVNFKINNVEFTVVTNLNLTCCLRRSYISLPGGVCSPMQENALEIHLSPSIPSSVPSELRSELSKQNHKNICIRICMLPLQESRTWEYLVSSHLCPACFPKSLEPDYLFCCLPTITSHCQTVLFLTPGIFHTRLMVKSGLGLIILYKEQPTQLSLLFKLTIETIRKPK